MTTPKALTLKFDANQLHQLMAISSVADLFTGLPYLAMEFRLGEDVVPNLPPDSMFDRSWLHENLLQIQTRNLIDRSPSLEEEIEMVLEGAGTETWMYPSFTIEMETGTGKTYVYLRAIHELRKAYGFNKFVIVVPSVAIYEGVQKAYSITKDHFASLYGNEPTNLILYDGSRLGRLRSFATSTFCEILLITLDAFNKATGRGANVLYRPSEKLPGERLPIQYIQDTRPILILDEPQNMESPLSRAAVATLHPLVAFRYSATHRRSPNLIFRLTPFEAFRRHLVKRIQVWGLSEHELSPSNAITLLNITNTKGIRATISASAFREGLTKQTTLSLKHGENLHTKTKLDVHRTGFVVEEINIGRGYVRFTNGMLLTLEGGTSAARPEVFRVQIEETIRQHFAMQDRLLAQGVKVLSLFFVDRVASYIAADGIVRTLFDKCFERQANGHPSWRGIMPEQVRGAYFAKRQTGSSEQFIDVDLDETRQTKDQREALKAEYRLIMRDKESLLSFSSPVAFIFAHSALKEGWDNPNVFQICTLSQSRSEIRKRQEIGRGLRLCVNQNGDRVIGDDVNTLTVVANESYERYASELQQEYIDDGEAAERPPKPSDARKGLAKRNDQLFLGASEFREFWVKLAKHVKYEIRVDQAKLVQDCVTELNAPSLYPDPMLILERGRWIVQRYKVELLSATQSKARIRVLAESSSGEKLRSVHEYSCGDSLAARLKDNRLKGFTLAKIMTKPTPTVRFENGVLLTHLDPLSFETEKGQQISRQQVQLRTDNEPRPDLIGRASRAPDSPGRRFAIS